MSQTTSVNTGNQLYTNTDNSKVFIGNNETIRANYTNSEDYDDVTLAIGTVMGRVHATNEIIPAKSDASDGSQFPVGVLLESYTVAAGDTKSLPIVICGDVAEDKLVFAKTGDGLNTVVSARTYRDRLAADTKGIRAVSVTDLTDYDNS